VGKWSMGEVGMRCVASERKVAGDLSSCVQMGEKLEEALGAGLNGGGTLRGERASSAT
jgi:hypothetical protein